ncbi:MAG: aminotransferase class I/II-fold pyridoxal phosphate-dependent enzyme [Ruminococcus sp.]|nr:aminotransferase class I/II-fold pyridoxal phosphate-dependent enzyme [Ruminococcus sp.]
MLLNEMSKDELLNFKNSQQQKYDEYKSMGLSLNMARGKPCTEQLDLTLGLLDAVHSESSLLASDGTDVRNYGVLDGLPKAKVMFSQMLGVSPDEVIVGGNSSLNMMYDSVVRNILFGTDSESKPWKEYDKIKWLCPSPGYDRHFAICESLGIEMITVPMLSDGPDMDMVEQLVAEDEAIKGIWCVPMYSNPTGITYSDEVVKRFAALSPKASDFRIFWDNAYCIHHLTDTPDKLLNIMDELKKNGKEDMIYIFASTSKVSFPGAGVAAMAASEKNIKYILSKMTVQTIGPDKINQLRHYKFFGGYDGLVEHMKKHTAVIAPRFKVVIDTLEKEIAPLGIGTWHNPNGGYFVSFNSLNGCAKRIVSLCKEAGVVLTKAGATYPYGNDPDDKNIRIAPTYPSLEELKTAMEIFVTAVKLASAEKLSD